MLFSENDLSFDLFIFDVFAIIFVIARRFLFRLFSHENSCFLFGLISFSITKKARKKNSNQQQNNQDVEKRCFENAENHLTQV